MKAINGLATPEDFAVFHESARWIEYRWSPEELGELFNDMYDASDQPDLNRPFRFRVGSHDPEKAKAAVVQNTWNTTTLSQSRGEWYIYSEGCNPLHPSYSPPPTPEKPGVRGGFSW